MNRSFLEEIKLSPLTFGEYSWLGPLFKDYFRIDPDKYVVEYELLVRDVQNELTFYEMKLKYSELLSKDHDASSTPKIYVDDNIIVYIYALHSAEIISSLPIEGRDLYPICSVDEIGRVLNVKNTDDALLLYRCSSIVHNTRIARVIVPLASKTDNWSLTRYFDDSAFEEYLGYLPTTQREICHEVTAGFVFTKDANGFCVKTEFGNIIVVSESLKYFLYYMNLFLFASKLDDDNEYGDGLAAYKIAVRILLGNESLDFDIDPRCKIEDSFNTFIVSQVDRQIKFIIGHEYAHHLLNHLESSDLEDLGPAYALPNGSTPFASRHKNSFNKEYDADRYCLQVLDCDEYERSMLLNAAFQFFLCLELYEVTSDYMYPQIEYRRTHPKPLDRLWNLRRCMKNKYGWTPRQLSRYIKSVEEFKQFLYEEYLPFYIDQLEFIGSVYLSSVGGKDGRGPLIDRIDF